MACDFLETNSCKLMKLVNEGPFVAIATLKIIIKFFFFL